MYTEEIFFAIFIKPIINTSREVVHNFGVNKSLMSFNLNCVEHAYRNHAS